MVSSNKEIKLLTINDLAACNAPLFHTDHMPAKKQGQPFECRTKTDRDFWNLTQALSHLILTDSWK